MEDWIALKRNPFIMIFILSLLPLVYIFVYSTGGIKYVFSHSMYIPIILAGIFYGASFGALIALLAGILLGPLMPIDTITQEMQNPVNWIYRLVIFITIGSIIGYASTKLRKDALKIQNLMSKNQETGIPNINFLRLQLNKLDFKPSSVMTLVINNYQNIIDVLGLNTYHTLLKMIYQDLTYQLNSCCVTVLSGPNKLWMIAKTDNLESLLNQMVSIVESSKSIDTIPLYIDYSIGASLIHDCENCSDLSVFVDSDLAAKSAHENNLIYLISNQEKEQKRLDYALLASFSQALKENQLFLVYQPKIDMNTNKPIGLEALIRWNHPQRGLIPPLQFIHLIEETKLIHELTDWVLKQALKKIKSFMAIGIEVPISINVSAKNLYDKTFFDRTIKMINDMKLPSGLIELEITESVLMSNPIESKHILEKFVKNGIMISLDDFGSGYSSLSYLTKFPIQVVKIDRLFMHDLLDNASTQEIVKSTLDLSKRLGYRVVVEGVENKETVNFLKNVNCQYAQGFFFARPMDEKQIIEWYKLNI